ncbi:MAG: winged helix-turn-helix domain-containing protein, partial [Pyrinomonadaceae bacterium]
MEASDSKIYSFARFRLDAAERLLFDGDKSIQLPPKAFDTLLLLVTNSGKVLAKERMLTEIWEGSFVEENNLAQNISLLRKLLGESSGAKFIETVPKFGYRFVVAVKTAEPGEEVFETTRARVFVEDDEPLHVSRGSSRVALTARSPETRYVQNGDANIAYQVIGEGDLDIVFVMGWISHLEYFWKHHLFASFLERLGSFS